MADQQITQLPEETGTVGAAFPLAIVNTTAAETRKISTANLATAIAANIGTGGLAASKVGTGYSGASLTDGTVTNAKLVSSSVNFGGVSVALGASDTTPAFNLSDATNYPASALTGTITNAQLAGSIDNSKLANSAVSFGGISVSLGAVDATPAFDLTDATNYKTTNLVGTITNAQLAGSIENAKLSNSSVSFGGISLALGASDPHPAFDLQDATGYKTTNLVGTITNSQLAGSIDASKLVANSLTSTQLGANCVGASELANNAVDANSVQSGAITNDKIETSSSSTTGIDGATKLRDGSVTASKLNASTVGNGLAINSNVLSINNTITGATSLGLTFSNQGICTGIAPLSSSDLSGVLATSSAVGVVKVPSSGGLSVSGSGDLSLATTITAFNTRGINVNAFGQVLSVSATVPSASLPVASTTAIGAIKVPSTSSPLTLDGNGVLTIGLSGVTAGTGFTKFNVNDQGLITSASGLDASDIPAHSAALLTSGTFDAARIPNNSIDANKLADSAVCQFSGATSTTGVVQFPAGGATTGTFFYDLTNDDLYVYDSNAWQPVTITSGEIIYAGNYSAQNNTITSLSSAGSAQGFTVGAALQAASAANNRYYFVCDKSGTGTSPAPTVAINPPDMILSNGTAWQKLDISSFIAGQSAQNISVAPNNGAGGGIHNTNVQSVLEELDTEKLNKTGGTVSGQLLLGNAASLVFEGSSDDAYELTLAVANPQNSDKTLTLPDITGTLITSADTNTVTSTMVDASLANANIAANAAIALSKLAAVSAGQILVGASGTGTITAVTPTGDIALSSAGAFSYVAGSISNADINASAGISASKIDAASTSQSGCVQLSSATTSTSATKAATPAAVKIAKDAADSAQSTANLALPKAGGSLSDNLILSNAKQVRFSELTANGANYISLQAPDTLAADTSYTLPSALPTANGQVLAGSTAGVLSWTDDPAGGWVTSGDNISYSAGDVTFTGASYNLVWDKSDSALEFADNAKARFGASNDLEIYHSGLESFIADEGTGGITISSGTLSFKNQARDETYATMQVNGPVELFHDNVKVFNTDGNGIMVKGPESGSANVYIYADEGDDNADKFQLTVNDGGPFHIQNRASGSVETNIKCYGGGAVELYEAGTKRFETTSTGATVTGTLVADGLDVNGNSTFGANGSITSGANFTLNGNALTVTGTATVVGEFKGATIPTIQLTQTTNSTDLQLRANATGGLVRTASNKPLVFGTNQAERMRIDSSGRCIVGGGTHAGGSALVVKGGNQNTYSTAGFFSNHTNPVAGTDLAQLRFGSNATGIGATIDFVADADWGTNDFPTKILFKTCPDGSNSRATALTLDSSQHASFESTVEIPARRHSGGTLETSTSNNWFKIGTLKSFGGGNAAQITNLGTAGYGQTDQIVGHTVINLRRDNGSSQGVRGHFYGVGTTDSDSGISDVATKPTGNSNEFDIYVKPGGHYSNLGSFVDISTGGATWVGSTTDTGSSSQPTSSTLLQKEWGILTGGDHALVVDSSQRVGIATTSPDKSLTIGGSTPVIKLNDGNSRLVEIRGGSTSYDPSILSMYAANLYLGANSTLMSSFNGDGQIKVKRHNNSSNSNYIDISAVKGSYWGYSGHAYTGLLVGSPSESFNSTIFMGVDITGNTNGGFAGDGREIVFRNNHSFVIPNAANNAYKTPIALNKGATTEGVPRFKQGCLLGNETADANILDSYEEGTWTPTLTCASGTITVGNHFHSEYTKVGRVVYVTSRITVSAVSSPSGSLKLQGLPFTSGSFGALSLTTTGLLDTDAKIPQGVVEANTTFAYLRTFADGSESDNLSGYVQNGTAFIISACYNV